MDGYNGIRRKNALGMSELIDLYIKDMKIGSGLNTRRIFEAWDAASGAAAYSLRKYFRDGVLYVTLSSSMARTQLGFQKDLIRQKVNAILAEDELFVKDDPRVGYVKEIVLK